MLTSVLNSAGVIVNFIVCDGMAVRKPAKPGNVSERMFARSASDTESLRFSKLTASMARDSSPCLGTPTPSAGIMPISLRTSAIDAYSPVPAVKASYVNWGSTAAQSSRVELLDDT